MYALGDQIRIALEPTGREQRRARPDLSADAVAAGDDRAHDAPIRFEELLGAGAQQDLPVTRLPDDGLTGSQLGLRVGARSTRTTEPPF